VDSVSPTVFCISEAGDLIKWFDCSDYMREPSDIAIFNNEYFVCDFKVFILQNPKINFQNRKITFIQRESSVVYSAFFPERTNTVLTRGGGTHTHSRGHKD